MKKMQNGGDPKKRKGAQYTEQPNVTTVTRKVPVYNRSLPAKVLGVSDIPVGEKYYKKTITGNDKTGGTLTVTKGGKTNTFNIPKGKVSSQKTIAKKETGYMKTGGMVNPNATVQASKVAKGRPAKSAEPKSAAKKATGKTGGISKAPRSAKPKK